MNNSGLIMGAATPIKDFNKKWNFRKNAYEIGITNAQYPTKVGYDVTNEIIYKIVRNKIPELFQKVTNNKSSIIQHEMDINISDDINNPLNKNKDMFSKVINLVSEMVFHEKEIKLKYDECQKIVKDIKEANSIENANIFEL